MEDETLFDWDNLRSRARILAVYAVSGYVCMHAGWMMYVEREKGLERVVHGAQTGIFLTS